VRWRRQGCGGGGQPAPVRDYARACGRLAKTDRIDALVLAAFARAIRPQVRALRTTRRLSWRTACRRRQLIDMRVQENCGWSVLAGAARQHQEHIAWLTERIARLDTDLTHRLRNSSLCATRKTAQGDPGVGTITRVTLIALLPELGKLNRREIAALVDLPHSIAIAVNIGRARDLGWACSGPAGALHGFGCRHS